MTRKKISIARLGAAPQSKELAVKTRMHKRNKRFRPNNPASHPLIGSTMALDTRYDVSTHVLSSLLAPKLPARWGRATLAMLVSVSYTHLTLPTKRIV